MTNKMISDADLKALAAGSVMKKHANSVKLSQVKDNLIFIAASMSGYAVLAAGIAGIAGGAGMAVILPTFLIGMVARLMFISGTEFDASPRVHSIFLDLMLLETIVSIVLGSMATFGVILGGGNGISIYGAMAVIWTLATGAFFASARQ